MSEWMLHMQKPLSPLWIPTKGLNQHKFQFLLEQRPCQPITQTQEDGDDGGVLRTCVHQILILVVTYQTLTVPSITLWNHDSLLLTHSTCAFLSVRFGFYCLIVTKNSTDCMKVTHMYYLFLFLYLHLQLGMKECLCRTSCRLQHLCYLFLFIRTLPAWRTTLLQLIYI